MQVLKFLTGAVEFLLLGLTLLLLSGQIYVKGPVGSAVSAKKLSFALHSYKIFLCSLSKLVTECVLKHVLLKAYVCVCPEGSRAQEPSACSETF
jgi:hypothetical protein